jgi:hypothetical protein
MFEAVRGSLANGYVAIDNVEFDGSIPLEECIVFPPEAVVKPTDTPPVPLPNCDFEVVRAGLLLVPLQSISSQLVPNLAFAPL